MIDFERILHPTDFSAHSNQALLHACGLSEQYGAELHLLHVSPDPAMIMHAGPSGGYVDPNIAEDVRKQSEARLAEIPEAGWAEGRAIVRVALEGVPYVEICDYAEENAIDLIVLGTHGRSGFAHMLLGSVAERVVRVAKCPVLTVKGEAE